MDNDKLYMAIWQCVTIAFVSIVVGVTAYNITDRVLEGHTVTRQTVSYIITPSK